MAIARLGDIQDLIEEDTVLQGRLDAFPVYRPTDMSICSQSTTTTT